MFHDPFPLFKTTSFSQHCHSLPSPLLHPPGLHYRGVCLAWDIRNLACYPPHPLRCTPPSSARHAIIPLPHSSHLAFTDRTQRPTINPGESSLQLKKARVSPNYPSSQIWQQLQSPLNVSGIFAVFLTPIGQNPHSPSWTLGSEPRFSSFFFTRFIHRFSLLLR